MSLVLENVILRAACIVLIDFMTLVKYEQILSLFNQAYYDTNYCVFSVGKCYFKGCCIVLIDFMTLVKYEQILSLFNQAYYYMNYCVFSVYIMK